MQDITNLNQIKLVSGGFTSLDELTPEQLAHCESMVAESAFMGGGIGGVGMFYLTANLGPVAQVCAGVLGVVIGYWFIENLDKKIGPYCNADMGYYDF